MDNASLINAIKTYLRRPILTKIKSISQRNIDIYIYYIYNITILKMKQLKYTKKMQKDALVFMELINTYSHKLNKEYLKNMHKLIDDIAIGEKLDATVLKNKYLKSNTTEETVDENTQDEGTILEKIVIDGAIYYYENIENGIVYNSSSKKVGIMKNNKIELNSHN